MGGDHGPVVTLAGLSNSISNHPDLEATVFGSEDKVLPFLKKYALLKNDRIDFVHTTEIVKMDDMILVAAILSQQAPLLVRSAKLSWIRPGQVLGWGTTRERPVLQPFFPLSVCVCAARNWYIHRAFYHSSNPARSTIGLAPGTRLSCWQVLGVRP